MLILNFNSILPPPALHQSPVAADTAGAAVAGSAGSVGSAAAVVVDSAAGG